MKVRLKTGEWVELTESVIRKGSNFLPNGEAADQYAETPSKIQFWIESLRNEIAMKQQEIDEKKRLKDEEVASERSKRIQEINEKRKEEKQKEEEKLAEVSVDAVSEEPEIKKKRRSKK